LIVIPLDLTELSVLRNMWMIFVPSSCTVLFSDIPKTPLPICQFLWHWEKHIGVHFFIEVFEKRSILPDQLNPHQE